MHKGIIKLLYGVFIVIIGLTIREITYVTIQINIPYITANLIFIFCPFEYNYVKKFI